MPTVFIPPTLRDLTGGVDRVCVEGSTLRRVVESLDQRFPGIAARLCSGDDLAPGLAVSVDGHLSTRGLLPPVAPESEIHFLPAISGG